MSTELAKDLVTLSVDGKEINATKGELLIAACEASGIFIPRFCYHSRLPQVGMCRMCLVEVSGPRGFSLQPSCYVAVAEGMEVMTNSEKVRKAQDGVLEFLLINHPLDCPVCDKGGECPLQDQTLAYGPGESRFSEEKRHFVKPIPVSDLVLLDRERCIQCDRCTRFADVIAGDPLIEFIGRGDNTEVNVFPERPFSSYFSGNTVQICPVGALTAVPYRFKARPWDLAQVESSCTTCSVGCRIMVQSSQNEVTRYLGLDSDPVNQGWLCDKGRFGHEALVSPERLTTPLVRRGERLEETSWSDALAIIASKLKGVEPNSSESVGVLLGSRLTNEDIYAWVKLAKSVIGTNSVDTDSSGALSADVVARLPRATIDEAVSAKAVLAFTGDIKEELPVLYLRLRQAIKEGQTKLALLSTTFSSLKAISEVSVTPSVNSLPLLTRELLHGSSKFPEISDFLISNDVGPDGDGLVVLLGRENLSWDKSIPAAFALELAHVAPKAKFLVTLGSSNLMGAVDLGAYPSLLPGRTVNPSEELLSSWGKVATGEGRDVYSMFDSANDGAMEIMFLVGTDPRKDFLDSDLANRALDGVEFVVSIDTFLSESSAKADIVLPAAAFAEKAGTTTNLEGRVLSLNQKVTPPGLCISDWEIASEIANELGMDLGFGDHGEILDEIAMVSPLHFGLSWERVAHSRLIDGVLVPIEATPITVGKRRMFDQVSTPGIASVWNQGLASSKNAYIDIDIDIDSGSGSGSEGGSDREGGSDKRQMNVPLPRYHHVLPALIANWPLAPLPPARHLELALVRKLYSRGEHLSNSPHLAHLSPAAQCSLSNRTARELGVTTGDTVRMSDRSGGSAMFEVKVVPTMRDATVEIIKGTFGNGFSPIRANEKVNFVEVERA